MRLHESIGRNSACFIHRGVRHADRSLVLEREGSFFVNGQA